MNGQAGQRRGMQQAEPAADTRETARSPHFPASHRIVTCNSCWVRVVSWVMMCRRMYQNTFKRPQPCPPSCGMCSNMVRETCAGLNLPLSRLCQPESALDQTRLSKTAREKEGTRPRNERKLLHFMQVLRALVAAQHRARPPPPIDQQPRPAGRPEQGLPGCHQFPSRLSCSAPRSPVVRR